jgi:citrate synthase
VVDTTSISRVNPETNSLLYRGYAVGELAASCSVEEVAYLLWHGELPDAAQLEAFRWAERSARVLPALAQEVIDRAGQAHPMDVLRTAVSTLSLGGDADAVPSDDPGRPESRGDTGNAVTATADLRQAYRLFAALPTFIARNIRVRHGQAPIPPSADLDYVENFLTMCLGALPSPAAVDAFRISLILYMEHSFNASTFTARVIASTRSDMISAVVGAIGALKGPLHGGANEAVLAQFAQIRARAEADGADGAALGAAVQVWLEEALANRRIIMGFGHRVYKNGDSRVPIMRAGLERLAGEAGRDDVLTLYRSLEEAMGRRKGLKPNLDYASGPVYDLIGFDREMFTPLFAAARVVGWSAHVLEQQADNTLIRPLSAYRGVAERPLPNRP